LQRAFNHVSRYVKIIKIHQDFPELCIIFMYHSVYLFISVYIYIYSCMWYSGAQGEYAGLRVIRSYLQSIGHSQRNVSHYWNELTPSHS